MSMKSMQELWQSSALGADPSYIDDLYEKYLTDPQSVPNEWQKYFNQLSSGAVKDISHAEVREQFRNYKPTITQQVAPSAPPAAVSNSKQERVNDLIHAYRSFGHLSADIDPLNLREKKGQHELSLEYHGLSDSDLTQKFHAENLFSGEVELKQIVEKLNFIYCNKLGFEYQYILSEEERNWFKDQVESKRQDLNADEKKWILNELVAADGLEKYLGTRYVGQKRFSLEGGDALIVALNKIIHDGIKNNIAETAIAMAHRGRLNVLVNVLGKSPQELFNEFEGRFSNNHSGSGDVKYHMGFSSDLETKDGNMHLVLAFNPSHLEIVTPVAAGSVRARQDRMQDFDRNEILGISIHGDSAFSGQGVVMEILNMSQTRAFAIGGTIRIVINNQVGFTTNRKDDVRSTEYCSDIAKMIDAPVIHVNGNSPEDVYFAAELALKYRQQFKKDVVIDLVCYRRHGHNEADDPTITQPVMYKVIKKMPTPAQLFTDSQKLGDIKDIEEHYRSKLYAGACVVPGITYHQSNSLWEKFTADWDEKINTAVPHEKLAKYAEIIANIPSDIQLGVQIKRLTDQRKKMAKGELPMDWGFAENLAYASLVDEKYNIRLVGEDCGRGTFAHRHAIIHSADDNREYLPLENISKDQGRIEIYNSLLSENAVLGFEYGYSSTLPDTLCLWEAQFGDFANCAQVVIDQFISSGEQKWGRLSGLVMLLPHGYEGMGPEHSSARLERYLQLCAQNNMQVCVPTLPSQIFHLLRRQMLRNYRKPLIVMTPKSLLRHKLAVSNFDDLSDGQFYPVIDDIDMKDNVEKEKVNRIVLCSGKVYYDLLLMKQEYTKNNVAIIRVEQLYPFPTEILKNMLQTYPNAKDVIWCQEEPKNQGAWYSSQHHVRECLSNDAKLRYVGRAASASPATGLATVHLREQKELINMAIMV